ncbi:MAG TPA: 4'-phosphopantetheinyl transferase superfamily protein [Gammaproteobacteria bacterium]|nr:4'-phosphopantetheinyl transferase superfamily protein [Xanthomonadales bacterium]MCB1593671.1 4'-phosphopantetheinyl transferase superfamily protein [Xanthomonadales bacterium]HOP21620.1 4'-phosphopantetheinyl transferase superfamily protein [Gammaproteobacteria bacterium]
MIYVHRYQFSDNIKHRSKEILKLNISNYLNRDINKIEIKYNENGKPFTDDLFFSQSHSQNQLVQVFSQKAELGVDLEHINSQRKYLQLANRYFHANEYKYLKSLNNHESAKLFFQLWTSKESVCKAKGGRLWYFLDDNYLTNKNLLVNYIHGFHIKSIIEENFCLTLASETLIKDIVFVQDE